MQHSQSAEESDTAHHQQSNAAPPHAHTSSSSYAPAPPQSHTSTSTTAAVSILPQSRTDDSHSETPSPTDIADNAEAEPHQLPHHNNKKTKSVEGQKADKDHRLPAGPQSESPSESQGTGAIVTTVAATAAAAKANSSVPTTAPANQARRSSNTGASEEVSVTSSASTTAARTKADGVTLRSGVTARADETVEQVCVALAAPDASATSSGSHSATRFEVAHQNAIEHTHQRSEGTARDKLIVSLNLSVPREACRESSTEGQGSEVKGHSGDYGNKAQEVKADVQNTSTQTEVTMESHEHLIGLQRVTQEVKTISTQTDNETTMESADRLTSNGHQRAELLDVGTQTDAEAPQTKEEEEEEDDELTDSPCPSPDSSAAKDTLLLNSSFPIPSNPAHLAERIRRGRSRMSAAYDDTEYEPYGLPEVVMKGFADIPSGAACPYVLRRGLLGTPAVPLPTPEEPDQTDP